MERVGHLEYFDLVAGDKMAREPRLSALSLTNRGRVDPNLLKNRFSAVEWGVYIRLLESGGQVQCSSMGRVFDGVAALLGLADKVSYEGEAAMLLEAAAYRHFRQHGLQSVPATPDLEWESGQPVPIREIVSKVYATFQKTRSAGYAAAYFHRQLVVVIAAAARRYQCRKDRVQRRCLAKCLAHRPGAGISASGVRSVFSPRAIAQRRRSSLRTVSDE